MTGRGWLPVMLASPRALVPSVGAAWAIGERVLAGDLGRLGWLDLPLTLTIAATGLLWLLALGAPTAFRGAVLLWAVLLVLVRLGGMGWSIGQLLTDPGLAGPYIPREPIVAVIVLTNLAPAAEGLLAASGAWGDRRAVAVAAVAAVGLGLAAEAADAWFYSLVWGRAWTWAPPQVIGALAWVCLLPATVGAWLRALERSPDPGFG